MVDRRHDEIRAAVGPLVLYGLADWSGPRLIGSWSWANGVLDTAGLAYGVRNGPGPWVEVVATAGPAEEWVTGQRFATAMEVESPRDDEAFQRVVDGAQAAPSGEVTLEVDGAAKTFRYWPRETMGREGRRGWYAARADLVVSAWAVEPHEIRLVTVTDVEPYLAGNREHLLATYDAAP